MKEKCNRCGKEFEWELLADVFCSDLDFIKQHLCSDCRIKLKEWLIPSINQDGK